MPINTKTIAGFVGELINEHVEAIDALNTEVSDEDYTHHIDDGDEEFSDIAHTSADDVGNIELILEDGARYEISVIRRG